MATIVGDSAMSNSGREQARAHAFVELADTLVSAFDVTELAHRLVGHCVQPLSDSGTQPAPVILGSPAWPAI